MNIQPILANGKCHFARALLNCSSDLRSHIWTILISLENVHFIYFFVSISGDFSAAVYARNPYKANGNFPKLIRFKDWSEPLLNVFALFHPAQLGMGKTRYGQ